MSTLPLIGSFCRESYNDPEAVYETLKRRKMDLVTTTDHDCIDAGEELRRHPDFFLSEEVTCRMPSGTVLHVAVYDITERQHTGIEERRDDLPRLLLYLAEQNIFFAAQHAFSSLTGRREHEDFEWLEASFPAFEVLNGHVPVRANWEAARLGARTHKTSLAGSDSHTMSSLGSTYTEVHGARNKVEFFAGLRRGEAWACGESGGYCKLTADVFRVTCAMWAERPSTLLLAPLAVLIPLATLVNCLHEAGFVRKWAAELDDVRSRPQTRATRAGSREALA